MAEFVLKGNFLIKNMRWRIRVKNKIDQVAAGIETTKDQIPKVLSAAINCLGLKVQMTKMDQSRGSVNSS